MSTLPELFSDSKPKSEPIPTRDTAAADLELEDRERKRKSLLGQGMAGTMLTGPGGVPTEMTGTRHLY